MKKEHGRRVDLAAVEVHQPQVVWHFEISFVEEEAGWYADDVRGGGEEELCGEKRTSDSQLRATATKSRLQKCRAAGTGSYWLEGDFFFFSKCFVST